MFKGLFEVYTLKGWREAGERRALHLRYARSKLYYIRDYLKVYLKGVDAGKRNVHLV